MHGAGKRTGRGSFCTLQACDSCLCRSGLLCPGKVGRGGSGREAGKGLTLSEPESREGVKEKISLTMFHLQREKRFVSRGLFLNIIRAFLIVLELKLVELE